MPAPRERITYEDYLQLPEESRYEVLEGDLRMVPAPGEVHQRVLSELNQVVRQFIRERQLGRVYFAPMDVVLDVDSVVQPDLLVVMNDRLSIVKPEGVRGAPDLVVEVVSPGTAKRDRGIKRRMYSRYGVQEYWIVDPQEGTVEVSVHADGGLQTWRTFSSSEEVLSPLFPGLSFSLAQLLQA